MDDEKLLRADVALFARGLAVSRERAQSLIASGLVTLNRKPLNKPSVRVSDADVLEVLGSDYPYVSRGGLKLEKALQRFHVDPTGCVCLDVGASTGGFTDVLLRSGAKRVYAVDVGAGQLDASLAADARVVSMEHTNARTLNASQFPILPTLAVMDVSFISIRLILPALFALLGDEGRVVSLVKPQFEAGPQHLGKKGVVGSARVHLDVLRQIVDFAPTLGWTVRAMESSPIAGTAGNLEFLADFVPLSRCVEPAPTPEALRALVESAHRQLRH